MPGIDLKGDGIKFYFAVIKEDVIPKLVEVFLSVEGNTSLGSTSVSLPNRQTIIRTTKQEVLDIIDQFEAVLDVNVIEPE
jgi:hypothetical protein